MPVSPFVFYSVLYISLHRYDGGYFFPTSTDGDYTMVGRGDGKGFNVNIPWHYVSRDISMVLTFSLKFSTNLSWLFTDINILKYKCILLEHMCCGVS